MSKHAIKHAAQIMGSQQKLARAIGLRSQGSISQWIKLGRVPAERVLQIEKATKGAVSRHELRPDLYPVAA
jgi:DNA-binding transcriptional regulator YdaS (Cro superfamily)